MPDRGTTLVLCGTGTTGSRVAAGLRKHGDTARIVTRRPTASSCGEQVRFDWSMPDTFGPALAGVTRVYLVAPGAVLDAGVAEPFLAAALAAGVRRVVLLSASAAPEGTPGLGELHRTVAESLPEWTVPRPSWFMQNFIGDHRMAVGIRDAGEMVTATGDGRVGFVDAGDIAAVALRARTDDRPHNTEHLITGPEALSYSDVAAIIGEVTGREVLHRSVGGAESTSSGAAFRRHWRPSSPPASAPVPRTAPPTPWTARVLRTWPSPLRVRTSGRRTR